MSLACRGRDIASPRRWGSVAPYEISQCDPMGFGMDLLAMICILDTGEGPYRTHKGEVPLSSLRSCSLFSVLSFVDAPSHAPLSNRFFRKH